MSALEPWDKLPKVKVFITRHWRTRGIYEHEAAVLSTGYYTNENTVGNHWTPYTLGVDCFLTSREAWHKFREHYREAIKKVEATLADVHEAEARARNQYLRFHDDDPTIKRGLCAHNCYHTKGLPHPCDGCCQHWKETT